MKKSRPEDGTIRLAYREAGDGIPVVLIHGFPFSSAMWRPQLEALSRELRVIAPDLRGFGDSPVPPGPYTMGTLAADIIALLDELRIDRAVMGGLSMGGYVLFEVYRRDPGRVAGLVLADTRPDPDTAEARDSRLVLADRALREGTRAIAEPLIPRLLSARTRSERPDVERELREIMESQDPRAVAAALEGMALRADARPLLRTIDVPTLVITGSEDAITPPESARAMAEQIRGAGVVVIDGAGHVSNLEAPDRFNPAVSEFLNRVR